MVDEVTAQVAAKVTANVTDAVTQRLVSQLEGLQLQSHNAAEPAPVAKMNLLRKFEEDPRSIISLVENPDVAVSQEYLGEVASIAEHDYVRTCGEFNTARARSMLAEGSSAKFQPTRRLERVVSHVIREAQHLLVQIGSEEEHENTAMMTKFVVNTAVLLSGAVFEDNALNVARSLKTWSKDPYLYKCKDQYGPMNMDLTKVAACLTPTLSSGAPVRLSNDGEPRSHMSPKIASYHGVTEAISRFRFNLTAARRPWTKFKAGTANAESATNKDTPSTDTRPKARGQGAPRGRGRK